MTMTPKEAEQWLKEATARHEAKQAQAMQHTQTRSAKKRNPRSCCFLCGSEEIAIFDEYGAMCADCLEGKR